MRAEEPWASLRTRLEARRQEMEQSVLARVYGISDPTDLGNPRYVTGLNTATAAAVDFALAAIGSSEQSAPEVPEALREQVRLAARQGVSADIVLRRYVAGFTLLGDFVLQEAAAHEPPLAADAMQPLLHAQATLLDHMLAVLGEEHRRAGEELQLGTPDVRRLERVRRLLAGELLDASGLGYPFDAWHLGLLATGPEASPLLRDLAGAQGHTLLAVQPDDEIVWAWFGARRPPALDAVLGRLKKLEPLPIRISIGEPGEGLLGWRRSHLQAAAALPIVAQGPDRIVRYADVILLTAVLQDDLLARSLRQLYLEPLEAERDGGARLRETLRAYFKAGGSPTAAAASLGVNPRTVSNRLLRVEDRIGRPLRTALTEIDAALRMEEFESAALDLHIR